MSDDRFSREDMKRNEDPSVMAGSVIGAVGAGFGASVGLAALGPLGLVIGVLAGAAGGWWGGKELHGALTKADRADNAFRRAHEHAGASRPYEEVQHGYRLGYLAGSNPDHAGADFAAVEQDLRTAWVKAHHQDEQPVPWEEVRDAARTGFELAREEEEPTGTAR